MRGLSVTLAVASLASMLGGCAKDNMQHGPFVIGPNNIDVRDDACCPSKEIRSQDAHGNWKPCTKKTIPSCHSNPDAEPKTVVEDLKHADQAPAAKKHRSAWEG